LNFKPLELGLRDGSSYQKGSASFISFTCRMACLTFLPWGNLVAAYTESSKLNALAVAHAPRKTALFTTQASSSAGNKDSGRSSLLDHPVSLHSMIFNWCLFAAQYRPNPPTLYGSVGRALTCGRLCFASDCEEVRGRVAEEVKRKKICLFTQ
jgi:hypothetical protein